VYAFFEKMSGRNSVITTDPLPSPTKRSRIITLKVPRHFLIRDRNIDNPNHSISATSAHQMARNSAQVNKPLSIPPTPQRITIRIKVPKPCATNNDDNYPGTVSADASPGTGTKKRKTLCIDDTSMPKQKTNVVRIRIPRSLPALEPCTTQCPEKQAVEDIPQPKTPTNSKAAQGHIFTSNKLCLDYVLEPIPVISCTTPSLGSDIEMSLVPDDRTSETTSCPDSVVKLPTCIRRAETLPPNTNASQQPTGPILHDQERHPQLSCDGESHVEQPNIVASTNPEPVFETSIADEGTPEPVLPTVEAVESPLPRTEISSPTIGHSQPLSDSVDLILQFPAVPSDIPMENQIEFGSSHSHNVDPAESIALLYHLNRELTFLHRRHQFHTQQKTFRQLDEGITLQIDFK
jgi:hypothetical protein